MHNTNKNDIFNRFVIPMVCSTIYNYGLLLFLGFILPIGSIGVALGINVAAVGDISCETDGKNTIDNIASHKPQLVLFLG